MKYRVEIEERRTITRETWVEAASRENAREIVEALDWRTLSEVCRDTEAAITMIEDEAGEEIGS